MKALFIGLLLSVTMIWGYGIIVTDDALGSMQVFTMLAGRFLLAAVVLFLARLCLKKTKQYARFSKKEVWAGILVGIVNFFGFFFQSIGLLYTDTAKSGMLTGAYVILVPVVYCVLRKKFQWKPLLNACVFLTGMFFLFDLKGAGGNFNRGDAFTLLCAGFFAVQIILVDKFADGVNVFNFSAVQMLTMGLCGLVGALVRERSGFAAVDWSVCLPAVLYLGALSSAYAYIVQTYAQSRISPSLTAILLSLESLAGVLFSLLAGKVGWTASLGIGCAVMIAASVSAAIGDSTKPLPLAEPPRELSDEPSAPAKEEAAPPKDEDELAAAEVPADEDTPGASFGAACVVVTKD